MSDSSRGSCRRAFSTWLVGALALTSPLAAPHFGVAFDDAQQQDESSARQAQREQNLKVMGRRAETIRVTSARGHVRRPAELLAKPLFHYTDEPRRIIDATLWGWTADGRLQAICKIEHYDKPQPERQWLYCFGSLSTGLLSAEWPRDDRRWSSQKPGIELQSVTDAPAPAESRTARLRQMKDLAGRFHATILVDDKAGDTQEMRLLPRPLFRYEQPVGELVDGALFGLTTNGTNPDAVLAIELHGPEGKNATWLFGIAGMTAGGLTVKLDDAEVWTKPFVGNVGTYETWLWFFGKSED